MQDFAAVEIWVDDDALAQGARPTDVVTNDYAPVDRLMANVLLRPEIGER
jgi:hypothetical protein